MGQTRSVVLTGVTGHVIDVESHIGRGLPAFTVVGLPDASITEARERVRAAIASSGLDWPQHRVTVNLTPASLPKTGAGADVAVAVSVLAASGQIHARAVSEAVHLGELGLDGRIRPVRGVLPAVAAAARAGYRSCVVPVGNAAEAELVTGVEVTAVSSIGELARHYGNATALASAGPAVMPTHALGPAQTGGSPSVPDLADVQGQAHARWALEVAAAGGHHVLMTGPPGTGKTMLATRLPGLLPPLSDSDALEATSIHSLSGTFDPHGGLLRVPPFEAPHHSASAAAIVGGGSMVARPGAISRAHGGVLFLDEAPEFPARVLQTLRQPLESGEIVLHRAHGAARYPARFMLVMAANPCPCGNYDGDGTACVCSHMVRRRYWSRLSGPLLDRVDVHVPVRREPPGSAGASESTAVVAERVRRARARAAARLQDTPWVLNAHVSGRWLRAHTPAECLRVPRGALERGAMSARGFDRVLRLAWTLSDLHEREAPEVDDIHTAMALRAVSPA